MAVIIPNIWPGFFPEGHPEHEVYCALASLPESYTVFYSKKFKGALNSKEECEVDFLIFDGVKNLICLEVKGGLIKYDGTRSQWYQNDKPMDKGPDRQASAARAAIIEFFGNSGQNLNIDWALCFPNCSLPAHVGGISEVPKDLIIDSASMVDLPGAIEKVNRYFESHHGRSGVTATHAGEIIKILQRSMGFVSKIGHRFARDAKMIAQATEEQMEVLYDLELNKRVLVEGYAGTGKTLIAQEFAKRLDEDGKNVLFLFYNRMIAGHVRYGLGRQSKIECQTFHHFARAIISESDSAWWKAQDTKAQDFWDDVVPLKLMDVIENTPGLCQKYDAIIIDEGQDFKRDWFDVLEGLLVDPQNSKFVVFFDSDQDLFGRWDDISWSQKATRKLLTRNCRNTKKIVNYLKENYTPKMRAFELNPTGVDVTEHKGSKEELRERFRNEVEKLLQDGISSGDIIVLTNAETWKESSLYAISPVKGHQLTWSRRYDTRSNDIQVCTIKQFKGMEAPVVFVFDVPIDSTEIRNLLYTQITRAQAWVNIFYS